MKVLPDDFYTVPDIANTTMTRKDLKELLLTTNGKIVSCGRLRTIKSKHIGAGVYFVTLGELKGEDDG